MKDKIIIILSGLICTTLIIFSLLFWPTLYNYEKINIDKIEFLVRANRLTGYTEILTTYGGKYEWKRVRREAEIHFLPNDEIAKIYIEGLFGEENNFLYRIYNGTEFTLKKIRLSIKAMDEQGKEQWQKIYEKVIDVPAFSASSLVFSEIQLMDYAGGYKEIEMNGRKFRSPVWSPEIRIEKVFGYKEE